MKSYKQIIHKSPDMFSNSNFAPNKIEYLCCIKELCNTRSIKISIIKAGTFVGVYYYNSCWQLWILYLMLQIKMKNFKKYKSDKKDSCVHKKSQVLFRIIYKLGKIKCRACSFSGIIIFWNSVFRNQVQEMNMKKLHMFAFGIFFVYLFVRNNNN